MTKTMDIAEVLEKRKLQLVLKRLMDIAVSGGALLVLWPVLLLIALAIKIDDPGPVFYRQVRVGRGGKTFRIFKFRTMIVDADKKGLQITVGKDNRITRMGALLRKTKLDELAQLINVFTGEMSFVGPRPEVPFHVRHFKEEVPRYLVRQQVRPGITGWAQVNGLRGDTSIEERVKYDIWYIENWSIWLDFRILLMTAFGGMVNKDKMN